MDNMEAVLIALNRLKGELRKDYEILISQAGSEEDINIKERQLDDLIGITEYLKSLPNVDSEYDTKDCLFNVRSKGSKGSNEIIGVYGFYYDQESSTFNFILWNHKYKLFESQCCNDFEIIEGGNINETK